MPLSPPSSPSAPALPAPGLIPVLPTVFDAAGSIVPDALSRQIDFAVQCGVRWACLPAFGSEFYKLDAAERDQLIAAAASSARGRLGLVVQCNHGHAPHAASAAARAESQGAAMVSTALPRNLPASEASLVAHAVTVARATRLPVVVQDWNPSGPSLSAPALAEIAAQCPNFAFLKLEEPAIAQKSADLRALVGERVRILVGWGGLYLHEQLAAGVAGVMPGLPLLDVFQVLWRAHAAADHPRVYRLHALLLPYIQFSLRNLEQFHHCEKALAVRRGLLPHAFVREPTVALSPPDHAYLDHLLESLLAALATEGFPPRPLTP